MKIYKFSAKWCHSCKVLQSKIDSNWDARLKENIISIDIDSDMNMSKQYAIRSLPTVVVTDDVGKEVARFSGAKLTEEALLQYVK